MQIRQQANTCISVQTRTASMYVRGESHDAFSTTAEAWKQVPTTLRPLTKYDLQKLSSLESVSIALLSYKLTMTKHLKLIRISNEKVRAYLSKLWRFPPLPFWVSEMSHSAAPSMLRTHAHDHRAMSSQGQDGGDGIRCESICHPMYVMAKCTVT